MNGARIATLLRANGFEIAGFTTADSMPKCERDYNEWINRGFHGDMTYLEAHAKQKYRPELLLADAQSVIMVAVNYYQRGNETDAVAGKAGNVSRYAWGRDYHKVLGGRLKRVQRELETTYPNESFRRFADILPIAERQYAVAAGIGFIGRNTLLISRSFGSWVFLGGLLTTLRIEPSPVPKPSERMHCPDGCTRCIDACPTGALYEPFRIDASKCISYRTIEKKHAGPGDSINAESEKSLDNATGTWLFGCDECQSVCPFNNRSKETDETDFTAWIAGPSIPLEEIEALADQNAYVKRFAGSPLMRAKYNGLQRNAKVVRGNLLEVDRDA